jgi:hypothetical protein
MMREQTSRCKHYTHTGFDGVAQLAGAEAEQLLATNYSSLPSHQNR